MFLIKFKNIFVSKNVCMAHGFILNLHTEFTYCIYVLKFLLIQTILFTLCFICTVVSEERRILAFINIKILFLRNEALLHLIVTKVQLIAHFFIKAGTDRTRLHNPDAIFMFSKVKKKNANGKKF